MSRGSTVPFPEPTTPQDDRGEVLLGYLDYFRAVVAEKVTGLEEVDVRRSLLPSGWTPLELVHHLVHVERRWLDWGFEGEAVDDPWADQKDGRWAVPDALSTGDVLSMLRERGRLTRAVVSRHALADAGAPGERWRGESPATLERVLLHLLQEYARHVGHLDVVRELCDGTTGE